MKLYHIQGKVNSHNTNVRPSNFTLLGPLENSVRRNCSGAIKHDVTDSVHTIKNTQHH